MDNKNLIFILIILVIIFNCKVSCNNLELFADVNLDTCELCANGLGTCSDFKDYIKKDTHKNDILTTIATACDASCPDLTNTQQNSMVDLFIKNKKNECDICKFDAECYRNRYRDLSALATKNNKKYWNKGKYKGKDLNYKTESHYINHGIKESREPRCNYQMHICDKQNLQYNYQH